MITPIDRLRRLNRTMSRNLGMMDTSFLGRGRSLGAARVLNAIGAGRSDLSDLRAYLGLDSGLMSRILRALEEEGLIETRPDPKDARKRALRLTTQGEQEFRVYETLSNELAQDVLSKTKDQAAFLKAVDLVASVLGRDEYELIETEIEDPRLHYCMTEYVKEISEILGLQVDPKKAGMEDLDAMRPPHGASLLALSDGLPIGCCALKRFDDTRGEVKRLWVCPSARGTGLGKQLMARLEQLGRDTGYEKLVLDTNSKLGAAAGLYERIGWRPIERYNKNPYPDLFFEKFL